MSGLIDHKFLRSAPLLVFVLLCLTSSVMADDLRNVRLQLPWKHQFQFAGYYAAQAQGYYANEGLDVSIFEAHGDGAVIGDVLKGRAEFGVENSELLAARLQGRAVVILANLFKSSPAVLVTQPEIETLEALRGGTVMADTGDLFSGPVGSMLATAGVKAGHLTKVPDESSLQAFRERKTDAVVVSLSDGLYELQRQKTPHRVFSPASYGINALDGNLFTSEALMETEPELAAAFLRASMKGWRYALAHPVEVTDYIRQNLSSNKSRDALLFEAKELTQLVQAHMYPIGVVDLKMVSLLANLYKTTETEGQDQQMAGFVGRVEPDIQLSDAERRFLQGGPVLRVSVSLREPLSFYQQGKLRGYTVDLLELAATRLGISLEFTTAEEASGRGHIYADRTVLGSPDNVSGIPVLDLPTAIAYRAGVGSVGQLSDLAGYRVGVVKGIAYEPYLMGRMAPGALQTCHSSVDCITRLATGELDAVVDVLPVLEYGLEHYVLPGVKLLRQVSDADFGNLHHYFQVAEEYPLLGSSLDKAIRSLRADELKVLSNRWLNRVGVVHSPRIMLNDWERAWLLDQGQIRLCINPEIAPLDGFDSAGKHHSVSRDYVDLFARYLNTDLRLVRTQGRSHSEQALRSGRCDLMTGNTGGLRTVDGLNASLPYLTTPLVLFRKTNAMRTAELDTKHRFAVMADFPWLSDIHHRFPYIQLEIFDRLDHAIEQVAKGQVFALVGTDFTLSDFSGALPDGIEAVPVPRTAVEVNLLLRNDRPQLESVINKVIGAITEREHINILKRWNGQERTAPGSSSVSGWFIAAGFLLVILVIWAIARWTLIRKAPDSDVSLDTSQVSSVTAHERHRLSGLYSRLKMSALLQRAIIDCGENAQFFSVLVLDVDNLGRINDLYGRALGDSVLRDIARLLAGSVDETVAVGHWNAKQFVLICYDYDLERGALFARRLEQQVCTAEYDHGESISLSMALIQWAPGVSIGSFTRQLEAAMRRAKAADEHHIESSRCLPDV